MNSLRYVFGRRRAVGLAALGAAALTLSVSPVTARLFQEANGPVTIERKFEKDTIDRFRIAANVTMTGPATNGQETNIKLKLLLKQTVKEVRPDGSAVVTNQAEKATAEFGGQETDALLLFPRVTQTVDKRLRLLESKSEGGSLPGGAGSGDLQGIFSHTQSFFYPTMPVKVGDEWKIDSKNEKEKMTATGTASVVKSEKIGEIETLVVKVKAEMAAVDKSGKSRIDGTANLDTKTGKMVKMQGNLDIENGPVGKTKAEFSYNLVTEKDAEKSETEKKGDEKKEGEKGEKKDGAAR